MKKLFRSRWTRLTLALCMSMALLSTAAYAAEDTTGGGTSASVISAFQSGFQSMASDAMEMIAIIVPIAVGVAGVIWLARKAMSWFKSMGQ